MRRVLVAAAHVDLVNGVIDVGRAGRADRRRRRPHLVRPGPGHRRLGRRDAAASDQPEAIVSIGAGLTVVVVHQDGRPQFVRTIGSGGNATTAAISASLDVPIVGRRGTQVPLRRGQSPRSRRPSGSPSRACSSWSTRSGTRSSTSPRSPTGCRCPRVADHRRRLRAPRPHRRCSRPRCASRCTSGSPLDRLDTSKLDLAPEQADEVGPVLASPIGLALPEPDKAVKKFNLLPPEVAQQGQDEADPAAHAGRLGRRHRLLVLFGGWKFLQVHNAQNNVNTLQATSPRSTPRCPKYDLVVAANDAYTKGLPDGRPCSTRPSTGPWPSTA